MAADALLILHYLALAIGLGGGISASVVAAVAAPFIVAALGLGVLAAGGIIAILAVALVGALIVLAIVKAVFD